MKINIKSNPINKTKFRKGTVLGYKGSNIVFMVVGEYDHFLHTFILNSGIYWGIAKLQDNLECLKIKNVMICPIK